MSRILVIRFSSLGDVAVSVPLLQVMTEQYPQLYVTMLSKAEFSPLFEEISHNLNFHPAYLKDKHKGIPGLFRLFRELKKEDVDSIIDLHDNFRSHFISFLFGLGGIKCYRIDKGRKEKRKLTRRKKTLKPLRRMCQRYADVFEAAGFPLTDFDVVTPRSRSFQHLKNMEAIYGEKKGRWIGIAPFARHKWKVYPLENMERVLARFAEDENYTVFVFGGGIEETAIMNWWKSKYPRLQIPFKDGLGMDLKLISCLDLMLSMDSANMHLASLERVPVVSVWGATHPYAGFYGLFIKESNAVQVDLPCRPCSIYGNKACYRKDFACMNNIFPEQIIDKIEKELGS